MKSKRVKWTMDMRIDLYNILTEKLGPFKQWPVKDKVFNNKKKDLYKELAISMSLKSNNGKPISEDAVEMQICWAVTNQEKIEGAHMETFFQNKAAALECGFIDKDSLPTILLGDK